MNYSAITPTDSFSRIVEVLKVLQKEQIETLEADSLGSMLIFHHNLKTKLKLIPEDSEQATIINNNKIRRLYRQQSDLLVERLFVWAKLAYKRELAEAIEGDKSC